MTVHLVTPGLLAPWPEGKLERTIPAFTKVEQLLARADKKSAPRDYPRTLFTLFGLPFPAQGALPTANLGWLADSDQPLPPNLQHADPVHLRADMDQVLLFDPGELSQGETEQLVEAFNHHFSEDGLVLHAAELNRWYVSSTAAPRMVTRPVEDVTGHNIDPYLPDGPDAKIWMQVFTELQMLFFDLPLNHSREAGGALPVNGLWFSGAGPLPTSGHPAIDTVAGDELLLNGLVHHAGISSDQGKENQRKLLVINDAQQAVIDSDFDGWLQALKNIEGKLDDLMNSPESLVLYPCNGLAYHWKSSRRFFFWRKNLILP